MPKLKSTAPAASFTEFVQAPIGFEHRLLAETVRLYEDSQGAPLTSPQADAAAVAADGDLEHRLIVRARSLPIAPDLWQALHHLHTAFQIALIIGLIMIFLGGATTAQVTLGSPTDGPVMNIFWVLGSLLGLHIIMLLVWLVLIFMKPKAIPTASLGNVIFQLGRKVTQWLYKGPLHVPALQAVGSIYTHTSIGRWTLSAISHGLWLSFLCGCLVLVIWILSIKQYTFAWETTILSDQSYVALTRAIASVPEALGFTTPDNQQIAASHWTGQGPPPAESREAWSGLLIGSIVGYGILPRLALLGLCLFLRRLACRKFRLDTTLPGYARLHPRLLPASQAIGVVDAYQGLPEAHPTPPVQRPVPALAYGPTAIMGFEIEPPASPWPPALTGVDWLDLGFVDSRDDRRRVLEQVRSVPTPPRLIAIVCSVTSTPDRGVRNFLSEIAQTANAPLVILLTDGQRLRERGPLDEVEQRFNDWKQMAAGAAIAGDQVIDADLEHLTETSRTRLAALLGGKVAAPPAVSHLDRAFALIVEHAGRWKETPDPKQQAELNQAIAALYDHIRPDWRALLKLPLKPDGDMLAQVKTGAQHMLELLPARLRLNPRWAAAGGVAGAMSCIAAATLVAPAAIASLPLWAGMGAVLGALAKPAAKTDSKPTPPDFSTAVNGAALFALVLELQGRPETVITRIIDRVAGDNDPPELHDAATVRQWLEELRQRFDSACQAEEQP
ncbi:MAG: DUF2868 domain-containing protein [Candidatus Competibacteraceae bacterium]